MENLIELRKARRRAWRAAIYLKRERVSSEGRRLRIRPVAGWQPVLPNNHGRGAGVGRGLGTGLCLGDGVGRGVGVTVTVAVAVAVAVGVAVGVAVAVAVAVGLAVGVGVGLGVGVGVMSDMEGARTLTVTGDPVLKNPMFAVAMSGAELESNEKLYNVPQRIALAFWFWTKVSQFQVAEGPLSVKIHGVLLYPALLSVPSFGQPGCCGGAWNLTLLRLGGKRGKTTSKDWTARSRFMLKMAYS